MVWAGIISNGHTNLHISTSATVKAETYRDDVLDPHVKLFRCAICNKFLLMDYNAYSHRAVPVTDCLESEKNPANEVDCISTGFKFR